MNRHVQARLKKRAASHAREVDRERLDHIRTSLLQNLADPSVQSMIDAAWRERAAYRAAFKEWKRLGGVSIVDRIGRLMVIAQPGTIHEKKWLLRALASIWVNPPIAIIQDSIHYDIHIKVKSLRNTNGRGGGSNPWEWKRDDVMSIVHDSHFNFDPTTTAARAHVKQVERASYADLTKWLIASAKRLVKVDERITIIEDKLHAARASGVAHGNIVPEYVAPVLKIDKWEAYPEDETGYLRVFKNGTHYCTYRDFDTAVKCGMPSTTPITIIDIETRYKVDTGTKPWDVRS